MEASRWIVVGMDFSDGAARALERALELARTLRSSVACVHAYEDAPGMCAFDDPAPALQKQIEEIVAQASCDGRGVKVNALVRRGPPWEKLINVATELGAEFIVVGTNGQRGAADKGFLGTVATRLVTLSRRPVIVVPSRQTFQSVAV
jgi:nucleotide-binding universal stress UspA family protein